MVRVGECGGAGRTCAHTRPGCRRGPGRAPSTFAVAPTQRAKGTGEMASARDRMARCIALAGPPPGGRPRPNARAAGTTAARRDQPTPRRTATGHPTRPRVASRHPLGPAGGPRARGPSASRPSQHRWISPNATQRRPTPPTGPPCRSPAPRHPLAAPPGPPLGGDVRTRWVCCAALGRRPARRRWVSPHRPGVRWLPPGRGSGCWVAAARCWMGCGRSIPGGRGGVTVGDLSPSRPPRATPPPGVRPSAGQAPPVP
jgi:hypothetical protein